MTTLAEAAGASQLGAALSDGITSLSGGETVQFTKYIKRVLLLDGYVFWLAGETISVPGSLHYSAAREQREDETLAVNRVVFTTTKPVTEFNEINPQLMYVAAADGVRFAFSSRGRFYAEAGLYHYAGDAVYPALSSQLVGDLTGLAAREPIVSNSLPAWLSLAAYGPIWLTVPNPGIRLYPSFLVPANLPPPYGVVQIEPALTRALEAVPYLDVHAAQWQLATDHVRLTFYGLDNAQAQDWVATFLQYSEDGETLGLMSTPIMRDEKRAQPEIQAIAMKKTFEVDVSYYQTRMRDLARQLITSAPITYTVSPYP